MAVPDNEMDTRRTCGRDHPGAIVERNRHRLFDQHVLAIARRKDRMRGVKLMRRRNVDDLDIRIGAKLLDRVVGPGGKILREAPPRFGSRISRANQRNTRVGRECRQHHGERAAEPRDADAQLPVPPAHAPSNSTASMLLIRLTRHRG